MKVASPKIKITKKNKVLFPKSGITKKEVILYYEKIADYILPHMENRLLTMQRFPNGITEAGFFQKNASYYFPDWVETEKVKKKGGWVNHVICNTKETLIYLANQYTISFHLSLSKIDKIQYPDKLVFDLDPPNGKFNLAIKIAIIFRDILEESLDLTSFVMTSGSRGLHVVVPLICYEDFDEVREFAKQVASYIAGKYPNDCTTAVRKDQRKGRLYIDFIRNSYSQTSVAPFSLRAIEHAPVATPLSWEELGDKTLCPQLYTIHNIFERLEAKGDSWIDFKQNAKHIVNAKRKLKDLLE